MHFSVNKQEAGAKSTLGKHATHAQASAEKQTGSKSGEEEDRLHHRVFVVERWREKVDDSEAAGLCKHVEGGVMKNTEVRGRAGFHLIAA